MLKSSPLFQKNTIFMVKYLENFKNKECKIFRLLFLCIPKHTLKCSNLHYCTFESSSDIQNMLLIFEILQNLTDKSEQNSKIRN